MSKSTKELALCSIMTAVSSVHIWLCGVLPLLNYVCVLLASAALIPAREECSKKLAWCCFVSSAALGLVMSPDKETAFLYCFLGYYPLIQPRIASVGSKLLRILIKLLLYTVCVSLMYLLLLYVIGMQDIIDELATNSAWLTALTFAAGFSVFALFDLVLPKLSLIYLRVRNIKYGGREK